MLIELATNHIIIHEVFMATNFIEINAILIAFNEVDYLSMWIQVVATTAAYQMAAGVALISALRITASPVMPNPGVREINNAADNDPVSWICQLFQALWNAYLDSSLCVHQDIYEFLKNPIANTTMIIKAFLTNPEAVLVTHGPLLFSIGYQLSFNIIGRLTWCLILRSSFLVPLASSLDLLALASGRRGSVISYSCYGVGSDHSCDRNGVSACHGARLWWRTLVSGVSGFQQWASRSHGNVMASGQGVGMLGFAGTAYKEVRRGAQLQAGGLAILAGDELVAAHQCRWFQVPKDQGSEDSAKPNLHNYVRETV
nr:PPE domain-containing protein [Mycobacterium uberis]